jgi:DNA primase
MTVEEMESLLDRLEITYVGSRGDEIQGFCPAHEARTGKADRNPSWYINSETGAHICFSCQFKGSIAYLVSYLNGFEDLDEARTWINEGGKLSGAFEHAVKEKKQALEELVYISEATLAAFVEPPTYALKSRGLHPDAARKHEILWDSLHDNWIIPIRDPETKRLLGWQEKGYQGRFFRNQPQGIQKSVSLFGYDKYSGGDMILVESPLDVVRLESIGLTGGVASFGTAVSNNQIQLLKSAERLIIAMDNDDAGNTSASHLLQALLHCNKEAWFFDYSDTEMKDVGAMSRQEVLYGIESAIHSVRYSLWDRV